MSQLQLRSINANAKLAALTTEGSARDRGFIRCSHSSAETLRTSSANRKWQRFMVLRWVVPQQEFLHRCGFTLSRAEAVGLYTCCSTSYLPNSQPAIDLIGSGSYHQPFSARFNGLSSVCPVGIVKIKLTLSRVTCVCTAGLIYHTQKQWKQGEVG